MLERLTAELRARLDFIGVDWANDNDDEDEDEDEDTATREATKQERKQVRMLDYACGTGMMSRVSIARPLNVLSSIPKNFVSSFPIPREDSSQDSYGPDAFALIGPRIGYLHSYVGACPLRHANRRHRRLGEHGSGV